MKIEPLLTVSDVMKIFGVSQVSVYRWVALARQGKHRFPLPIGDYKQKLRWNRDAIVAYQNANNPQPAKMESASQRQKRHVAAMDRLRSKGVNINTLTERIHS